MDHQTLLGLTHVEAWHRKRALRSSHVVAKDPPEHPSQRLKALGFSQFPNHTHPTRSQVAARRHLDNTQVEGREKPSPRLAPKQATETCRGGASTGWAEKTKLTPSKKPIEEKDRFNIPFLEGGGRGPSPTIFVGCSRGLAGQTLGAVAWRRVRVRRVHAGCETVCLYRWPIGMVTE